jgi:hypothetical protein
VGYRNTNQIITNITGSATAVTLTGNAEWLWLCCSVASKFNIGTTVVGSGTGQNYFLLPANTILGPVFPKPGQTVLSAIRDSGTASTAFTVIEQF